MSVLTHVARRRYQGISARPAALLIVLLVWGSAASIRADNHSWNTAGGDWGQPGNWLPAALPISSDTVTIGDSAPAINAFVKLDQNDTVSGVTITDGMILDTDGFRLTVLGDTTVSGRNEDDNNVIWPSRIQVDSAAGLDAYDTDNLTVTDEAEISLRGGILEIDEVFSVDESSAVRGDGVIDFGGSAPRVFVLAGTLQAGTAGLTLNQNGTGRIDLDGQSGGNSGIHVGTHGPQGDSSLTVNGDQLADAFSGSLTLGSPNVITMNLTSGWTADASSEIFMLGSPPDAATIAGSPMTIAGDLHVWTLGRMNVETTFTSTANIDFQNNDELRLNADATFAGASFTESGAGNAITPNASLTVTSDTTVDIPASVFDLDGDVGNTVTTINPGVAFTINADAIENDALPDPFEGQVNVGDGGTFSVNTTADWPMAGIIDLDGGTVNGSGIDSTGTIRGHGSVAPASLDNSGTLSASDGATLVVEPSGTNDLDGSSESGIIHAQFGDVLVHGIESNFPFNGTLRIGFLGVDRQYRMSTGGLRNLGTITMDGGEYEGGLIQSGLLVIDSASRIDSDATFDGAGTNTLNANLQLEGDSVVETGAVFNGNGNLIVLENSQLNGEDMATVGVLVDNFGRVEPGLSTGDFNVAGYINEGTGTLAVELAGDGGVPGTDLDLLDVRGIARLVGGTLEVSQINGFQADPGDSFTVLTATEAVLGTFDIVTNINPQGIGWIMQYNSNDVTLLAALLGDMDCDGDVDFDDIDDFIWGLNDPQAYEDMYGIPPSAKGDADGDGDQDFDDIAEFIDILNNGIVAGPHVVPEPPALPMALIAMAGLVFLEKRKTMGCIA